MSNSSFNLVDQPGRLFEPLEGRRVDDDSVAVNLVFVEFSCVLPPLAADEPGSFPVFTLARGAVGDGCGDPGFWCPSTESGGVFLRVTYDPSEPCFHFGMNAGTGRRELQWISLGPAYPEDYTRQVLRVFVLISPTGLYPSVQDAAAEAEELFGELALAKTSERRPWGGSPEGTWWALSSAECAHAEEEKSLPDGFGLSDVRVTLIDSSDVGFDPLPYSGALDHLVSLDLVTEDDWASDFEDDEPPMSQMLLDLAEQLHQMSGGAGAWARRAEGLAEETRELVIRLPEETDMEDAGA